jgi:glycosyltransferase involved in cell wall biosynthesis
MNFSVAICTYNGGLYLREQLDSILSQTIPVEEIVVCDDASTDNTLKILDEYQAKFPTLFKIYKNGKSLGFIKNFEKAINLCTKDFILLSDQDDIWFPEKTQRIKYFFQLNTNKDAVFHNLQLLKNSEHQQFTIWDFLLFTEHEKAKKNHELINYALIIDNFVTGAAFAFRRQEQLHLSADIDSMLHDFQLFFKFASTDRLGILNESLGYYRIHEGQQIGAKITASEYIKERKNRYTFGTLRTKADMIESVILRNSKNAIYFPILEKANTMLINELKSITTEILQDKTFFQRKRILFNWFRHQKYNIKFTDLFFL